MKIGIYYSDKRKNTVWTVIRELVVRFFNEQVGRSGAELSYYLLFSFFPLLIVINAVLGLFQLSPDLVLSDMKHILPTEIQKIILDYLSYLNSMSSSAASALLVTGLSLSVYSMFLSMGSLICSVKHAYRIERKGVGTLLETLIITVLMIISFLALILIVLVSKRVFAVIRQWLNLPISLYDIWDMLRYFIFPVYLFFALLVFYHIISRRQYKLRWSTPGALFSVAIGSAASYAFSLYVSNMGKYSTLYGSIGAIIILLIWLHFVGMSIIMGGVLNQILLEQRKENKK